MVGVLLIGNGAREHAIAETLARSPQKPKLFSYMKARNPGIARLSAGIQLGDYGNISGIIGFAMKNAVDFAIIGPEDPLDKGVADTLEQEGISCVGPKKELARLETSKSFTRLLMEKYRIGGNPKFQVFESTGGIRQFLDSLDGFVIKPDGLTGGKGVKVQGDHLQTKEEALQYCEEVLQTHPAVVVEEKLDGEEFSLQCLCDGKHVVAAPPVQDHKRAFVDDKGPNTGGMGSYSAANHLLPFLKKEHIQKALEITQKVCNALNEEIGEYKGVMYGGFILTQDGVKLIEYNARFGDPEAMNVLPLLKTDFVAVCHAIITGELSRLKIEFEKKATVCKYAVPKGYPGNPVKNQKADVSHVPKEARMYYASVDEKEDGLHMGASRALAFVGIADTLEAAEDIAEKAVSGVKGPVFHRPDIGTKALIEKRIKHMQGILGKTA